MTSGVSFEEILPVLKEGGRICRQGWNGKGMYLFFVPQGAHKNLTYLNGILEEIPEGVIPGTEWKCLSVVLEPFICMRTVDGKYVPWLASQTDILADDWMIEGFDIKEVLPKMKKVGYHDEEGHLVVPADLYDEAPSDNWIVIDQEVVIQITEKQQEEGLVVLSKGDIEYMLKGLNENSEGDEE